MALVEIRDLSKAFITRGNRRLAVLNGVTITADHNQFVCLLGPSGCGKSTVLNILAGLVQADQGSVRVVSDAAGGGTGRPRMGYVFQKPRLLNWRTVRENLTFALDCAGVDRSQWPERVERYVRMVGLEQFIDEYPLFLSGGMQQRVAIARALAIRPDVLLMDEPFSALDELTARGLRSQLLRIVAEERVTVLFVTHNATEAVYLADVVYVMSNRPATVLRRFTVDLPRPRHFEDPALLALQKQVVSALGVTD